MASTCVAQAFGRFTWGVVLPDARDDVLGGSNTLAGLFGTLNVTAYLLGTLAVSWMASRLTLVGLVRLGLVISTTALGVASIARTARCWRSASSGWASAARDLDPGAGDLGALAAAQPRRLRSGWSGRASVSASCSQGRSPGSSNDEPTAATFWQTLYRIEFAVAAGGARRHAPLSPIERRRPSGAGGFGGIGALKKPCADGARGGRLCLLRLLVHSRDRVPRRSVGGRQWFSSSEARRCSRSSAWRPYRRTLARPSLGQTRTAPDAHRGRLRCSPGAVCWC